MNINYDSIYESLLVRFLCAWVRRKNPVESNFSIAGWALSVNPYIVDDVKGVING